MTPMLTCKESRLLELFICLVKQARSNLYLGKATHGKQHRMRIPCEPSLCHRLMKRRHRGFHVPTQTVGVPQIESNNTAKDGIVLSNKFQRLLSKRDSLRSILLQAYYRSAQSHQFGEHIRSCRLWSDAFTGGTGVLM